MSSYSERRRGTCRYDRSMLDYRRRSWWIIALVAMGLYWLLAIYVRSQPDNSFDRNFLDWVLDIDVSGLTNFAQDVSDITDTPPRIWLGTIATIGVALAGRLRFAAAIVVALIVIGIPTNYVDFLGGVFTERFRPNEAPFRSYPSGHTLGTVTQAGIMIYVTFRLGLSRWINWLAVAAFGVPAVLVGPARLFVNVHWPTDVIGSYFLGTSSVILSLIVFEVANNLFTRVPVVRRNRWWTAPESADTA